MALPSVNRRDFGKLVGVGGLAAAAPALLTGTARAETPTWRMSGERDAVLSGFDDAMKRVMESYDISCGQLAVMRHGKLLLSRAYTNSADPALETTTTSLFRIASLSKAITATAMMKYYEQAGFSLLTPITDVVDKLYALPGGTREPRLDQVHPLRLMQHLGGWDRGVNGSPASRDHKIADELGLRLPINRDIVFPYVATLDDSRDVQRWMEYDPGTKYAYSNFGYWLVGEAIEQLTGGAYPDYVQQNVLGPLGITRMRQGRSLLEQALPEEVPYVEPYTRASVMHDDRRTVPSPYGGYNLENSMASGAWLATAVDYTRFMTIMDDTTDVLTPDSTRIMRMEPETGVNASGTYYGCGWSVRPYPDDRFNIWHSGALHGSRTIAVSYRYGGDLDGLTWAALINRGVNPQTKKWFTFGELNNGLTAAARDVTSWPDYYDLSDIYF